MGEVVHYLDASFLVALLTRESATPKAVAFAEANVRSLVTSDFAAAEYASSIARRVRMGEFALSFGQFALATFDGWIAQSATWIEISPADIALATSFLRRLDLPLRTPDAIHIAAARRIAATLVSFDHRMLANAGVLGLEVASL